MHWTDFFNFWELLEMGNTIVLLVLLLSAILSEIFYRFFSVKMRIDVDYATGAAIILSGMIVFSLTFFFYHFYVKDLDKNVELLNVHEKVESSFSYSRTGEIIDSEDGKPHLYEIQTWRFDVPLEILQREKLIVNDLGVYTPETN